MILLSELDAKVFFFVKTSSFHYSIKGIFPAELAIAKFSLQQGIFEEIQIRINPGELPMGSLNWAQSVSEKTHRFPLPPNCPGEADYMSILAKMIRFMDPFDKLPILYTEGNHEYSPRPLDETRRAIEKIFYESQEDDVLRCLKVYPIEELFFMLQKKSVISKNRLNGTVDKTFPSLVYAFTQFGHDSYRYITPGCKFHNKEESVHQDSEHHCCLSKVRRYAYTISEWCSDRKRYPLIAGQHYPL